METPPAAPVASAPSAANPPTTQPSGGAFSGVRFDYPSDTYQTLEPLRTQPSGGAFSGVRFDYPSDTYQTLEPKSKISLKTIALAVFVLCIVAAVPIYLIFFKKDSPKTDEANSPKEQKTIILEEQPKDTGREARMVRLEATKAQMLHVTEIVVNDDQGEPIPAAQITATLGPQHGDAATFGPQFLTDGQTKSKASAAAPLRLAHTTENAAAFMQLDLGRDRKVTQVLVYNRDDCCKERIVGAKIVLRDAAGKLVCEQAITGVADVYVLSVGEKDCALGTLSVS